jgi:hypothetical protein
MMAEAGRDIVAVAAGAVLWAVLWVGGTSLATSLLTDVTAGEPVTDASVLLGFIGYSVILSVAAGYLTAALAGGDPMRPVRWLAGLQLLLGIVFEVSAWQLTPVWYHLVFLVLLVPAILLGGRLRIGRGNLASGAAAAV